DPPSPDLDQSPRVQVIKFRAKTRGPWQEACSWLGKQMQNVRSPERRKLACNASELLGLLPWNVKKAGFSGEEPTYELWHYLSDEWL
ncbi:hypothetical protein AX17_007131, partial [Amanita inopinata Kibby_2008]